MDDRDETDDLADITRLLDAGVPPTPTQLARLGTLAMGKMLLGIITSAPIHNVDGTVMVTEKGDVVYSGIVVQNGSQAANVISACGRTFKDVDIAALEEAIKGLTVEQRKARLDDIIADAKANAARKRIHAAS